MADMKISALTALTELNGTEELAAVRDAASRKMTVEQIKAYTNAPSEQILVADGALLSPEHFNRTVRMTTGGNVTLPSAPAYPVVVTIINGSVPAANATVTRTLASNAVVTDPITPGTYLTFRSHDLNWELMTPVGVANSGTSNGGSSIFRTPRPGQQFTTHPHSSNTTGPAAMAGIIYFDPFVLPFSVSIQELSIDLRGASAGVVALAVYPNTDPAGMSSRPDIEAGPIAAGSTTPDTGTTTPRLKATQLRANVMLEAGKLYWGAFAASGTPAFRNDNSPYSYMLVGNLSAGANHLPTDGGQSWRSGQTVVPGTWTGLTSLSPNGSNMGYLQMRAAS